MRAVWGSMAAPQTIRLGAEFGPLELTPEQVCDSEAAELADYDAQERAERRAAAMELRYDFACEVIFGGIVRGLCYATVALGALVLLVGAARVLL